jgi:hypothetical protein
LICAAFNAVISGETEYKNNHSAWGPRSLDVPIYLDGDTMLLDTLASGSSGLWD